LKRASRFHRIIRFLVREWPSRFSENFISLILDTHILFASNTILWFKNAWSTILLGNISTRWLTVKR
jgi:hypothetical protein